MLPRALPEAEDRLRAKVPSPYLGNMNCTWARIDQFDAKSGRTTL
jgi:hypothetical protein